MLVMMTNYGPYTCSNCEKTFHVEFEDPSEGRMGYMKVQFETADCPLCSKIVEGARVPGKIFKVIPTT